MRLGLLDRMDSKVASEAVYIVHNFGTVSPENQVPPGASRDKRTVNLYGFRENGSVLCNGCCQVILYFFIFWSEK